MNKLNGKVAVITGGTSGMGLATAKRFIEEGAHVFIMGRRREELEAAAASLGAHATGVQGDIAKLADLDRLYESVKRTKGRLDVLFANAGVGEVIPSSAITEQHFDRTFDVNVKGTLFTVLKALPLLSDGASVILTGSIASVKGLPGFAVYSASKAAIRSFARTWAAELKDRKIRTNVISPGTIDTPILGPMPKTAIDQIVAGIPMGRMGTPDEIAKAAVFLASDDASFVTGIELFVDGGTAQI
jgi:NAD(P)-dependent dehydrogenase (short-subunit alcohol dehydrogenase family)